ncbi:MAG: hypothetical protein SGPRY_002907 [Prymnesium sp.]
MWTRRDSLLPRLRCNVRGYERVRSRIPFRLTFLASHISPLKLHVNSFAHTRGRAARKRSVGAAVRQARAVEVARIAFKQLCPHKAQLVHGGFPGAPVDPTVHLALSSPPHASCYERGRDGSLAFLSRHHRFFLLLAILLLAVFVVDICILIFAIWGAVFGIGIVGFNEACDLSRYPPENVTSPGNVQYPPRVNGEYVAEYCNLSQQLFNICIKARKRKGGWGVYTGFSEREEASRLTFYPYQVVVIVLTYINALPIPWRLAIMIHACVQLCGADRRLSVCCHVALHPYILLRSFAHLALQAAKLVSLCTLMFHIPVRKRAIIALLLTLGGILQIANCLFCLYYWPYIETQTAPGAYLINLPVLFSLICLISACNIQGNAEKKLIAAQPDRFSPPLSKYIRAALAKWRSGESGKPLLATIRGSDSFRMLYPL